MIGRQARLRDRHGGSRGKGKEARLRGADLTISSDPRGETKRTQVEATTAVYRKPKKRMVVRRTGGVCRGTRARSDRESFDNERRGFLIHLLTMYWTSWCAICDVWVIEHGCIWHTAASCCFGIILAFSLQSVTYNYQVRSRCSVSLYYVTWYSSRPSRYDNSRDFPSASDGTNQRGRRCQARGDDGLRLLLLCRMATASQNSSLTDLEVQLLREIQVNMLANIRPKYPWHASSSSSLHTGQI